MHLLVRETHGLDEDAPARELGQTPAPLVVLSFSDADLGAFAEAWSPAMPELRLANLGQLRHPMSVDLYVEQVLGQAKCVLVRLLGGLDYWQYGAEQAAEVCRANGTALALLPGDAADDSRLRALSTVGGETWDVLDACLRQGGPANTGLALRWAAYLAGLGVRPGEPPAAMPQHGVLPMPEGPRDPVGHAVLVAYRSHHLSGDTAPVAALAAALHGHGLQTTALYVSSLKAPETAAWVGDTLRALRPTVILNATNFSARGGDASPLDAAGCAVLQVVLSSAARPAWAASARGLSPTDLAMQVVLPEADGRLLTTAVSFKAETARHPVLQHSRTVHLPDAEGVALAAARAAGWSRLRTAPGGPVAITLSNYPNGQEGHAVGLDTFASLHEILGLLPGAGAQPTVAALTAALTGVGPDGGVRCPFLAVEDYVRLYGTLPAAVRESIEAAWGAPGEDATVREGQFTIRHLWVAGAVVAIQPARGPDPGRYHDPALPPTHGYAAFYLWLRHVCGVAALIHVGTHGTLEWLPGKAAALSGECHPQALLGGVPVVYPFIVNNPGEAAPAKRRLGAVTIGHLTPPLARSPQHGPARRLEQLLDEYAAADGLDRRRTALLQRQILEHAGESGLLDECAAPQDAAPEEALARLDAYLCDVKDLLIRDGLHVYGRVPAGRTALLEHLPDAVGLDASPEAERVALVAALAGRFVQPGPAGAPSRGRADVLPTGRNLVTIDPRAIPTPSALRLAERAADALLRRHRAEQGEWPRTVVLDVWASTTIRTGGEDLALAFVLLGCRPLWDEGSTRVSGFEVLPIALLDRPRVDVTLRISGLFRDAFGAQVEQFDAMVRAVAARDEALDFNPLAAPGLMAGETGARALLRVYGPAPGAYGAGDGTGAGWAAASSHAYGRASVGADPTGLTARLAGAEAFVHSQDHAEHDLLDGADWAAHEGGFAAAARAAGAMPALYHLDTSAPEQPRARTVAEEIARVVRGRAANPLWIEGQMRHGFSGAAEIARPMAALMTFAETLPERFDRQFDLLHAATLGTEAVDTFLAGHNPAAHQDLVARFEAAQVAGLWHPRRNAVVARQAAA